MLSSIICMLVFGVIGLTNAAAIVSGSGNVAYDVPIPRGYTQEEYVKSIIAFWTPERMASAIPLHPTLSTPHKSFVVNDNENDAVEEILTPSVAAPESRGATTPPAAGRAFFVMNNLNYVCSGSVVNAPNRDTVVTAGHCVYNNTGKIWATNWTFIPDYDNKQRPFGTFVARKIATKQLWKDKGDFNHDVAIVTVSTNENGEHAQDVTGAFGITLNAATANINAFGFPMNMNNGETMSTCASSSKKPSLLLNPGFKGIQITCGMAGGASGGPWLQKYNAGTKQGEQVSVTSFSYALAPGKIHGPFFNSDNIGSLYQENQNA